MCVKTVFSMVFTELAAGKPMVPVQIISIFPVTIGNQAEHVPTSIKLPR
jgi:hypothetical protein